MQRQRNKPALIDQRSGQATVELKPFTHVTGADPSENMIRSAREMLENTGKDEPGPIVDFVQGSAENLGFLLDGSTDLVISGTSESLPPLFWFSLTSILQLKPHTGSIGPRCGPSLRGSCARVQQLLSGSVFLVPCIMIALLTVTLISDVTDLLRIPHPSIPHVDPAHRRLRSRYGSRDLTWSVLATARAWGACEPSCSYSGRKGRRPRGIRTARESLFHR